MVNTVSEAFYYILIRCYFDEALFISFWIFMIFC